MSALRGAALALVLAACGSSTPPPATKTALGNVAADAGVPPPSPGCPATWDAITHAGGCDQTVHGCDYPEGSCWCGVARPCSGVELDPAEYANVPSTWQCTPTPPAVRADGCPGVEPQGACAQEGQRCEYGDCCFTRYTCEHGQWVRGMASCPP